jgi:hypothetical protein
MMQSISNSAWRWSERDQRSQAFEQLEISTLAGWLAVSRWCWVGVCLFFDGSLE